jgi:hypothetical protein
MSISARKTALALAISGAALMTPSLASADGVGFMLGGGGYYANVDSKVDWEDIGDINFDDSSFAYNLDAGWRFNKWIALDAGYWDLGSFKADLDEFDRKQSFDAKTFSLGGIVSVPLWILDIYARGGAAFWDLDGRNIDEDGTDPYYGVGAALNIGGSLDLYLEWVRFDTEIDLDTFGLGARWTF